MEKVTVIKLNDGTIHETLERADRYLTNKLCTGEPCEVFEKLRSYDKTVEIKDYLLENADKVNRTMCLMNELKEILNEK